jgi:membrane fusion protein, multidrug efflux system
MRYVIVTVGLLVVIGGLVGIKAGQISSLIQAGEAFAKAGPPPEAVSTDVARELTWDSALSAVGTVGAYQGVSVSNEVAGVVKKIHFASGGVAESGQALLELDTGVERAQLATAQARRDLAKQNLARSKSLFASQGIAASQLDNDESLSAAANADVDALRAQIERKTVRAPFAGKLGICMVNFGQYLNPGTVVTTVEALDAIYIDFALPQQALSRIEPGQAVRVSIDGEEKFGAEGVVAAVDPALSRATRSIHVRATVPNADLRLRPGMFAKVSVMLPEHSKLVAVPATAVVHAPYGDSIFLVEPVKGAGGGDDPKAKQAPPAQGAPPVQGAIKQVRQQFVRLGQAQGDFVAVLDGVKPGQELVSAGAFKLRNGVKVVVNNRTKPNPQIDPRPENR